MGAPLEPYQEVEKAWAETLGLSPEGMVGCSSGTAALHLAMEALGLPLGSRVIVPDFTMIACPRAVVMAGLTPEFLDCKENMLINVDLLASRASREVRAIIPTHIYGRRVPMDHLAKIATGVDWYVIEDLAEAHGILPHPDTDVACWSFYKNKVVAGEEGGACWFRSAQAAERARSLRSLGFTQAHDFWHIPRGHNYRLSNAHAKLILRGMNRIPFVWAVRRQLEAIAEAACPDSWRLPPRLVPWVYDFRLPVGIDGSLAPAVEALTKEGIPVRYSFKPMHAQEEFKGCRFYQVREKWAVPYPISCKMAGSVLYLPLTPGEITFTQIERAFQVLKGMFPIE